jgi:hypothetical protein
LAVTAHNYDRRFLVLGLISAGLTAVHGIRLVTELILLYVITVGLGCGIEILIAFITRLGVFVTSICGFYYLRFQRCRAGRGTSGLIVEGVLVLVAFLLVIG